MNDAPMNDRPELKVFLASFVALFLELACIRWFPAHVPFLTFFTNTVLLASFLGIALGCLAASRARSFIAWTPPILLVAMALAQGLELVRGRYERLVDVGRQSSPEVVYFGTEPATSDLASFAVPIEVVAGVFFVLVALALVGPGQELGRALARVPDRVRGYAWNIGGSLVGIAAFSLCSRLELPPIAWFAVGLIGLVPFLRALPASRQLAPFACLVFALGASSLNSSLVTKTFWSPYYRVEFSPTQRRIDVNQLGHQVMIPTTFLGPLGPVYSYDLPYLLERDSAGAPPEDVLVIGAGSGNDVARALAHGAKHVDAVEIDPAILRIGKSEHPDKPYSDERVTPYLDDGRHFLRTTERRYDLVVFALVDSLVLHSSLSSIRLESYLFTREAFADVKRVLKPDGKFVCYNFFRQGWVVARIEKTLDEVFGAPPLVLALPYAPTIEPGTLQRGGFTAMFAGDTARLRAAFEKTPEYHLPLDRAIGPQVSNGFQLKGQGTPFGLAKVERPQDLVLATDDWPFLYVRRPTIPEVSIRGMAIMGGLALVLLAAFGAWKKPEGAGSAQAMRMFFLGAGFMLVETKAVVRFALLYGSTWTVNAVVFASVLALILVANLVVVRWRPEKLAPFYALLLVALGVEAFVPLEALLGLPVFLQGLAAGLLVGAPIFFAGIVFAVSFSKTQAPDRDLGINVAGAMLGGLAENASMLTGFRGLGLVAVAFYVLSMLGRR